MKPFTTVGQIRATQMGIIVLVLMGLLEEDSGRIQLASYRRDSESFVHAANRLLAWDPHVSLPWLRELMPEADQDSVDGDHSVAGDLCSGLHALLSGESVDMKALQDKDERAQQGVPAQVCTATQVAPAKATEAQPGSGSSIPACGPPMPALTQGAASNQHEDCVPDHTRLRQDPCLTAADFEHESELNRRVLLSALKSSQRVYQASKNKESFNHTV